MPAPIVAVPPPVTLRVLVPFVPPLMVTLPSVAEATLNMLLPPPLFTVSPAPRVTVSLPGPRLMTSLLAAPMMVMVGEDNCRVSHVHGRIQPGAQRHRLCGRARTFLRRDDCDVRKRRRRRQIEGAPALQRKRVHRRTAVDIVAGGQRGGLGHDHVVGSTARDRVGASGQRERLTRVHRHRDALRCRCDAEAVDGVERDGVGRRCGVGIGQRRQIAVHCRQRPGDRQAGRARAGSRRFRLPRAGHLCRPA